MVGKFLKSRTLDSDIALLLANTFVRAAAEGTRVKAILHLPSEAYTVNASKCTVYEQLVMMKEESKSILRDFITKHNVPNDVPDEHADTPSEEDEEIPCASLV